jgi:hypothetical protein
VEPLADAVGLRALHLGPGVVDILDREIELIFVAIVGTAILSATIGQDLRRGSSCSSKNGITRSLRMSAAVSGILRV